MQQIFLWDQGTNLATAERPPVNNSCCTVWQIFQRKCEDTFLSPSSVLHLSQECLLVIKNSGIRKSRHHWLNSNIHSIPSSNTSCKQPSVSCVEAHVTVLLPPDCCCPPCHVARSRSTSLDVKRQSSTGLHSRHGLWYTLRKHHLLLFHYRLCFELRQLKLTECKCLRPYCQLYNLSHILIHVHRMF